MYRTPHHDPAKLTVKIDRQREGLRAFRGSAQDREWSKHAGQYDELFLNPFRPGVVNPLLDWIQKERSPGTKSVIDLGCGTGPLLPRLVGHFSRVFALDFAPAMIEKARERLGNAASRVEFLTRPMYELADLAGKLDLAVAVNSIVMPDEREIDTTLRAIRATLRKGGKLLAVVPAMDAIHYHTMLLYDRELDRGHEPPDAKRKAAVLAEHKYYEFAFGSFTFDGLRQKFWQPFEIEYRARKAGFVHVELDRVLYPWDDHQAGGAAFEDEPRSWDWFFAASV
jgi:SAM-dependent methyltransferase